MLPRVDGVVPESSELGSELLGGMRIAGRSANLTANRGSSRWVICCRGNGPRTRVAGCENVGRGTEGSVCFGTERGGTGPCTRMRDVGGERRRVLCHKCPPFRGQECSTQFCPKKRADGSPACCSALKEMREHIVAELFIRDRSHYHRSPYHRPSFSTRRQSRFHPHPPVRA